MAFLSGRSLFLPFGTVNSVQTLKDLLMAIDVEGNRRTKVCIGALPSSGTVLICG
jgi:hypothetical protein